MRAVAEAFCSPPCEIQERDRHQFLVLDTTIKGHRVGLLYQVGNPYMAWTSMIEDLSERETLLDAAGYGYLDGKPLIYSDSHFAAVCTAIKLRIKPTIAILLSKAETHNGA
jgi:hypothetical protein